MSKANFYLYLVCKKNWLGKLTPVKIFTGLANAKKFAQGLKSYVIFKQKNGGEMEQITDLDV